MEPVTILILLSVALPLGAVLHLASHYFIVCYGGNANQNAVKSLFATLKTRWCGFLVIELLTIGVSALIMWRFGVTIIGFAALFFASFLITMSVVDLKLQILPDALTKSLIGVGLVQGYFHLFTGVEDAVIGAVIGYGALWLVNTLFRLIRHKEGMGYGDFKLLAAIGAWVGPGQLPLVVFMASVFGLVVAGVMRKGFGQRMPFGPALAAAGFISLCFGEDILNWYLALFR